MHIRERYLAVFALATVVAPLLVIGIWLPARIWPDLDSLNRICLVSYVVWILLALPILAVLRSRHVSVAALDWLLVAPPISAAISILMSRTGGGVVTLLIMIAGGVVHLLVAKIFGRPSVALSSSQPLSLPRSAPRRSR